MLSKNISEKLVSSSWIRAMFEQGEKLRKIYGADKVFDFSLGNPDLEPPQGTKNALKKLVLDDDPGLHKYMNNAGFADVREKIAANIQRDTCITMTGKNIIMTCGAAGGLNVVLKTILNPGEEVIVFSPFFVEYVSYIDNHGGKTVISPCDITTFEPDLSDLEKRINASTKAIILNSPNNPTGVIYSEEKLNEIAQLLEAKEEEYKTNILVISDEPYTKLVYDGAKVPSVLKLFKNSVIVNSYSKSLALPGERIGYIAVNNSIDDADSLISGLIYSNRILGFVNAPGLFQKVIAESLDEIVDINVYKERRDILYNHLYKLGFTCVKPQGAFYLFPKALIDDDIEFVKHALKYNVLLVPGTGFGCPGYFRLSYSVNLATIVNSLPWFEAIAKDFR